MMFKEQLGEKSTPLLLWLGQNFHHKKTCNCSYQFVMFFYVLTNLLRKYLATLVIIYAKFWYQMKAHFMLCDI